MKNYTKINDEDYEDVEYEDYDDHQDSGSAAPPLIKLTN